MEFVSNPDLITFRENWKGNPKEGKRFSEYAGPINPGFGKLVRYLSRSNPQASEKRADTFRLQSVKDDIHQSGDWVCWLGHASFLIQLDGIRILTDPVFNRLGLIKRQVDAPYTPEEIGHLDYVLLSHDHRDHADEATMKAFSRKLDFQVLTTFGMEGLVTPWLKRGQAVTEAGWYQRFETDAAHPNISFMPTQHWCRRYFHDMNRRLWGSFVLEGKSKTIWFGGDSGYSPHFKEMAEYFPNIDLAMIGIGAYKPAWFMQSAHTNPEQAWQGFQESGAKQLLPMHYATYDLSQEPVGEPARLISACAKTAGRVGDLVMPKVGEVVREF
ncbi:MAG: MBL fold metallo-hydrolase [Saprospiraceae bacterium]